MRHALLCGVLTLAGVGCISESTRQLVNQSYQAGRSLEDDASLPAVVREKGFNIAENQIEVAQDIGTPQSPVPYSNKASAKFRKDARTTRENRDNFFSGIVGAVTGNIPWAGAVLGFAGAAFAWWKKNNGDIIVKESVALFESTVDGIERAKATLKPEEVKWLTDILRKASEDHNVRDLQKARVTAINAAIKRRGASA